MDSLRRLGTAALSLLLVAGCGSDPADVSGDYSVALTNRENGCMFDNWNEGDTSQNIPVSIMQDGEMATATVEGAAGTFLDLALGSRVYEGVVSGRTLDLELFGTRSQSEGNCAYTINSRIDAVLDGDVLAGDILYTSATNGSPDCGELEGCQSRQEFNGTRPPSD